MQAVSCLNIDESLKIDSETEEYEEDRYVWIDFFGSDT